MSNSKSVMSILSLGLSSLATIYLIMLIGAFSCSGWSTGTMSVDSCLIPGTEAAAEFGFFLIMMSSFTLGLPFIIPGILSLYCFRYWKNIQSESEPIVSTSKSTGTILSIYSALIFFAPVVLAVGTIVFDIASVNPIVLGVVWVLVSIIGYRIYKKF